MWHFCKHFLTHEVPKLVRSYAKTVLPFKNYIYIKKIIFGFIIQDENDTIRSWDSRPFPCNIVH